MAEYPKTYVKGDRKRVSHNVRDDVKLQFEGYRVVADPKTEAPAPAPQLSGDSEVPQLTEAEMAKLPEAKDAEVVDTTEEPKPKTNSRNQR